MLADAVVSAETPRARSVAEYMAAVARNLAARNQLTVRQKRALASDQEGHFTGDGLFHKY